MPIMPIRRVLVVLTSATLLTCAPAADAAAQPWIERFHVSFNGGYQPTANDFTTRVEFQEYLETGTTDAEYEGKAGPFFDGGLGVRLAKNFGVGVAVSFFTTDDTAATSSRIPHPFFDEQPREATGDATGLSRTDTAIHVQAQVLLDPAGPLRLVISGGPSFFTAEQTLVTRVRYTEAFPFDEVTFTGVDTQKADGSAVGFNAGVDAIWMVGEKVGIGGLVRYTRAAIDLDGPNSRTVAIDAGGLQAGGGIRFVF
jgi:outer membrane protein with beta-barrel domain